MEWEKQLKTLFYRHQWDDAITYMEKLILEHPTDVWPAINMNYLLVHLLLKEQHNKAKAPYYHYLAEKYIEESKAKFSDDPDYLFATGIILYRSQGLLDIDEDDALQMVYRAIDLEMVNILYQWVYYGFLDENTPYYLEMMAPYCKIIMMENSIIITEAQKFGIFGDEIIASMYDIAKKVLHAIETGEDNKSNNTNRHITA